jgi:hypothetical protein
MAEESIFGAPLRRASEDEEPTTEENAGVEAEGSPADAAPEAAPEPAPDVTQEPSTQPNLIVELTPEEMAQLQSAEQERQAAEGTEAPEGETPEEQAERLYANKYRTIEDLEKGYRERSDMWRRAMEARKAEEAERIRAEQQRSQYEQALRSAIPMLEQAAQREQQVRTWAEQYREQFGTYPDGFAQTAPQQGPPAGVSQNDVQRMLEERLATERAQMAADFQRQQEAAALERTVNEFYRDHPEVEPYGALDTEITDAMAELNDSPAWASISNPDGSRGIVVDPTDRGSLDVLYEAVQRPALLEVLKLRPDFFTSEAGLQFARRDAALLEGVPATTAPQTATVPASSAGRRSGQKVPFTESAQGTLPQDQGPNQDDPWERIKAVDLESGRRTTGGKRSIFAE